MYNSTTVSHVQAQPIQAITPSKRAPPTHSQNAQQAAAPSPGRFQHPAMTRIAKRQLATSFTSTNLHVVMVNAGVLLASLLGSEWLYLTLEFLLESAKLKPILPDLYWVINVLRLVPVINIYLALQPALPYFSKPDTVEDIPLTPSQRALLGLPKSQSRTPISQKEKDSYITPPRYRRASPSPFAGTPQSGGSDRRSVSANYSASPMSTSRYTVGFSPTPQQGSATPNRRASGSLYGPSSPLFNKTLSNSISLNQLTSNSDFSESTKSLLGGNVSTSSFGSSLRKSRSMREHGGLSQEASTPSPNTRERTKVNVQSGLNYKWLYEKGLKIGKHGEIEH